MAVLRLLVLSGLTVVCAVNATGQSFPSKPIRIYTSSVGGGSDFVSRYIAQGTASTLGQPVVVENRGGGGTVAAETVARADPDGHSLLVNGGTFWTATLMQKMSYDPVRDFAPITITSGSPNVLVVHPSVPVTTVKELIALAKSKPGQLNYGSGLTGAPSHLSGELFKSLAGVNIVRVPYSAGTGAAVTNLLVGEVQMIFADVNPVEPHLKSGRLRALAVTGTQPSALAPGLPTVNTVLPGFVVVPLTGMFAPARTPDAIISRLNQEVVRVLRTPEAKERFLKTGVEIVASSPGDLAAWIRDDLARTAKVIKEADIKVN